ncbi:MAG: hypothetical protein LQ349_009472, partial [Xanthoria aureola]
METWISPSLPFKTQTSEPSAKPDVHSESGGDFNQQNQKPTQTTDIDEKNLSYARQNILANNLKSRIRPLLTDPNDPLIPLDALDLDR